MRSSRTAIDDDDHSRCQGDAATTRCAGRIDGLADLLGIRSGPNVLILLGGIAVTVVCVHLSVEISRLEDRTRGLAEELGLLRLELAKRTEPSGTDHSE